MPYLSKKDFAELQRAGNEMANICYNLSQNEGQSHSEQMKDAQMRWDAICEQVRQGFIRRELRQEPN